MSQDRIGFIGLGDIGAPMAMRVLDAGHALTVYNRTSEKTQPFAEKGAKVAASLSELAKACDVILFCLSNGDAVEQVVFGPGGLAEAGRAGQVLVDLSTIHPVHTQQMAERLLARRSSSRWSTPRSTSLMARWLAPYTRPPTGRMPRRPPCSTYRGTWTPWPAMCEAKWCS